MMALSLDSANQLNLERKGGKKSKQKKNIPGLTEHEISHGLSPPSLLPSLQGSFSSVNRGNG